MENLNGKSVFCKRDGKTGTVQSHSQDVIVILVEGEEKPVTLSTFKRWWSEVPQEEPEAETLTSTEDQSPDEADAGGLNLRNRFISLVKDFEDANIEIICVPDKKLDTVKYNGKNIFEMSYTKNKLNVLAHPDSLTAANKSKIYKSFPKEWGWALRSKFVFTKMSEFPLMKSIIADGIFFRKENKE